MFYSIYPFPLRVYLMYIDFFFFFFLVGIVASLPLILFDFFFCQMGECRFNGEDLLGRLRGKTMMFVGDSLSLNQWQSMACLLHGAVPQAKTSYVRNGVATSLTFEVGFRFVLFVCFWVHVSLRFLQGSRVLEFCTPTPPSYLHFAFTNILTSHSGSYRKKKKILSHIVDFCGECEYR